MEEAVEFVIAASVDNRVGMLDAMADLMYIAAGTAVILDFPLEDAIAEVHRSNMTKNGNALNKIGDKGKDENYSEPNLTLILEEYNRG